MKSVKVNYVYNLIYKLLLIALPFITIPYTSRVLNPDGIGIYNYTNSIVCIFVLIASLGTSLYAQKEIAYAKDDIDLRSNIFKSIFTIRMVMSIIVTIPYAILIMFSEQYKAMYLIQYIFVIANLVDISWLLQGVEDFKSIALLMDLLYFCSTNDAQETIINYKTINKLAGLKLISYICGIINRCSYEYN